MFFQSSIRSISIMAPCHQMITQQQPNGVEGLSEVLQKVRFFSQPTPA